MGKAIAAIWIIGLLIYFFSFFLVIFSAMNMAADHDIDIGDVYVKDPGFQDRVDPLYAEGYCSGSLPLSSAFCSKTEANSNETCIFIPGCSWDDINQKCTGIPNLAVYGGGCSVSMNQTLCLLVGCSWISYSSPDADSPDMVSASVSHTGIIDTIGFMTGFHGDIGTPVLFRFITGFIFFWIPFTMLILAIYYLIPFIH